MPHLHFITTFCQLSISTHRSSPGSHIPVGIIAALAVLGALAILASTLCIYLFWRLRHQDSRGEYKVSPSSAISERAEPFSIMPRVDERPAVRPSQGGKSSTALSHGTSPASMSSLPSTVAISSLGEGSSNLLSPVRTTSSYFYRASPNVWFF